jgi:2-oxoisovalerate dehydrogenase E1 component subunit alpha
MMEDVETFELEIYRWMRLARTLDEPMWTLNRQGHGHFAVPCAGHEATGVGYALALDPHGDYLAPHYRDLAALLVWGITPREVMCHYLAKSSDPSGAGRQMYAHWGDARRRVLSLSSPQPNHVTHAVGPALAAKYRREPAVTWCGFGEGASSKGDVHESMNFAAIHKLPAVERARSGEGPTLVEAKVYRYLPHTSNDDDRPYRTREEVEQARARDPLETFRQRLFREQLLDAKDMQELQREVKEAVDDAVAFADAAPQLTAEDTFKQVYGLDHVQDGY